MKKALKYSLLGLVALAALLVIMGCPPGVTVEIKTLKGETIGYITSGNGLDYYQYVFNDDGTGGTWETGSYSFGFPTESAATSGNYTDQDWYMTDGSRGSFTYDSETEMVTATTDERYFPKDGETFPFYTDEYAWDSITREELGFAAAAAGDTYSETMVMPAFFNFDHPYLIGFNRVTEDGNDWAYTAQTTEATTSGGTTETVVEDQTLTYTITEDQIIRNETTVTTTTIGGTTDTETQTYIRTYTITNFFLVGAETGDKPFDQVWKKGNEVSFLLEQTKYENIWYEGTTPPTAPTVDPVDGFATNSGATFSYYLDMRGGNTNQYDIRHAGTAFFDTGDLGYAYRGLD